MIQIQYKFYLLICFTNYVPIKYFSYAKDTLLSRTGDDIPAVNDYAVQNLISMLASADDAHYKVVINFMSALPEVKGKLILFYNNLLT